MIHIAQKLLPPFQRLETPSWGSILAVAVMQAIENKLQDGFACREASAPRAGRSGQAGVAFLKFVSL
jgi:hypothetical protein